MELFFWRKAKNGVTPEPQQRDEVMLSKKDRMKMVFILAAILVAAATVLSVFSSANVTPLQHCKGILLSQLREACYVQLAGATGNASICSYAGQEQAREQCSLAIAVRSNDIAACSVAGLTQQDANACEVNASLAANSVSDCLQINSTQSSSECIYSLGLSYGFSNVTYCGHITNTTESANCRNIHNYRTAVSGLDAAYCAALPSGINGTPLYLLTENATTGISQFSAQSAPLEFQNVTDAAACYYEIASLSDNASLCTYTAGTLNTLCTARTSSAQQNSTLAAVTPASAYVACSAGGLTGSLLTSCENYLFLGVAASRHNATYCGYINNATIKSQCALSAGNSTSAQ